jgi:hypothetical protein
MNSNGATLMATGRLSPRVAPIALSLPLGLLLLLAATSNAFAKGGEGAARLDAPPPDDPPGTRIQIGWTMEVETDTGSTETFTGANAFVQVHSGDGKKQLVFATETPAGSGHYVASLVMPEGGIRALFVRAAEPGCSTYSCAALGHLFPISDELSGYSVSAAQPDGEAAPGEAAARPSPASLPASVVPIALALAGLFLVAVIIAARPTSSERAAGQGTAER